MENESHSAKRPGPKSSAQTPAKKSEQKKGSDKNKPGSAGEKGSKITFSDKVLESLKSKVSEHNKKYSKKVTLSQLKKVYRRGAGAFSSSHRPGKTRGQWAMARVNMFLKMVRGGKVKDSYRKADQDVAKASAAVLIDDGVRDEENIFTEEDLIEAKLDIYNYKLEEDPEFTEEMWSTIFIEVDQLGFEEIIDEEIWAAESNKGKKLNKPFRTPKGPKKFSVYVKNEKGNVVKVNFGDPNMEIKRDDPNRRKNFRARHNCANPGPKTKARYWSCKMWESKKSVTDYTKGSYIDEDYSDMENDMPEQNSQEEDHEKSMAEGQLAKISMQSEAIRNKISEMPEDYNLMAWAQDKISKAEHFIEAVYDYLMYGSLASETKEKKNYSSLWKNIQDKKKRMGKNYKPAKPGDKDYPSKDAIKKAQSAEHEKFKPHAMYDPKTGKSYMAKTYEDHLAMKKMGYTHEKPNSSKGGHHDKKKNN